jgi:hypothetical protein
MTAPIFAERGRVDNLSIYLLQPGDGRISISGKPYNILPKRAWHVTSGLMRPLLKDGVKARTALARKGLV